MISITAPENILFEQRDPNKIGNGRFDFEVIYEGNILGLLTCGSGNGNPMVPMAPNFMMVIDNVRCNLPVTIESISHLKTNEEIFDVLRQPVMEVYNMFTQRK